MRRSSTTVVEEIVEGVAALREVDPVELPPIYDVIEPDALDTILRSMANGEVHFRYADCDLTVNSLGGITIHDRSSTGDRTAIRNYQTVDG